MRISSSQFHDTTIRNIQDSSAKYSKLSVQMATNERITRPSDDPLGSVLVLRLNSELTSLEQYGQNMELVTYTLSQQETQLTSINHLLLSVQSLTTAAADGDAVCRPMNSSAKLPAPINSPISTIRQTGRGTGRNHGSVTASTSANRIAAKNSGGTCQSPTTILLSTLLAAQIRQMATSIRKSRRFTPLPAPRPVRHMTAPRWCPAALA